MVIFALLKRKIEKLSTEDDETTRQKLVDELIDFLDDYVADALPAEVRRRFEEHLARCALCVDYLATYRDTALDRSHPLAAALGDLRRESGVSRVDLVAGRLHRSQGVLFRTASPVIRVRPDRPREVRMTSRVCRVCVWTMGVCERPHDVDHG